MGRTAALVLTLLLIPASLDARAGERRQCRWGDLEARIKGRKIAFVLPDGTQVKGKVRAVAADGLQLRVSEGRVPRQSLSVLTVTDTGKKWRIICTIATPFVEVGLIGLAAGGYLLGWALDRKTTEIEIIRRVGHPLGVGCSTRLWLRFDQHHFAVPLFREPDFHTLRAQL